MTRLWISGLLLRRAWQLAGYAGGVAAAVGLLACLAVFLSSSTATMTRRAIAEVPIDWQIEAVPTADLAAIRGAIAGAAPIMAVHEVHYADVTGFEASTGGTLQATGAGKVLAFDNDYAQAFPMELRLLAGTTDGVLIAQQTAANLHAAPGDTITINRVGIAPTTVRIAGVIDLPDADALFQAVGLPPLSAPQAPPDNVLVMGLNEWNHTFGPQASARPDTVRAQFHVRLDHDMLPSNPVSAANRANSAGRNLEGRVAGTAVLANNLGTRLDAVREDALYARVLFMFLGVPGVFLAVAITMALTSAGGQRRRAEQALLRMRGASTMRIISLSIAEALLVGFIGILGGAALAGLLVTVFIGPISFEPSDLVLFASIAVAGLILSIVATAIPALRASRQNTVNLARLTTRWKAPLGQTLFIDFILLAIAAVIMWRTAGNGYQIVLAPEGVAATAVDYTAFVAPVCFWIGAALLTMRVCNGLIHGSRGLLEHLIRPVSGSMTKVVSASLSRQAGRITASIGMVVLAVSFGTSTAIFNRTYNAQARVDAELTNGADVSALGTSLQPAGDHLSSLAAVPGVAAAVAMQHRFAYVGTDLQDLYGIDPEHIGEATTLSDAYFSGGSAEKILATLKSNPDGVLVSEETVNDFQLRPGDTINLRLQMAEDHQYRAVPFKFIGIAREFPTAPRDSFLIANQDYIAKVTGSPSAEYVLMRTSEDPPLIAMRAVRRLGEFPSIKVTDISSAAHLIGSSLTSISLDGLSAIELLFAIVMSASAAGLMLALGFVDRRRDFAVLAAVGATPNQLAAFFWGEGLLITLAGIVFGVAIGMTTAWMLVKMLTGVFDPPPEHLQIPWLYLTGLLITIAGSIGFAIAAARMKLVTVSQVQLRDL